MYLNNFSKVLVDKGRLFNNQRSQTPPLHPIQKSLKSLYLPPHPPSGFSWKTWNMAQ